VTVRRQALKKLREAVGEDAYALGELSPYVPEWRFTEANEYRIGLILARRRSGPLPP
jgi:hypothetical protein